MQNISQKSGASARDFCFPYPVEKTWVKFVRIWRANVPTFARTAYVSTPYDLDVRSNMPARTSGFCSPICSPAPPLPRTAKTSLAINCARLRPSPPNRWHAYAGAIKSGSTGMPSTFCPRLFARQSVETRGRLPNAEAAWKIADTQRGSEAVLNAKRHGCCGT